MHLLLDELNEGQRSPLVVLQYKLGYIWLQSLSFLDIFERKVQFRRWNCWLVIKVNIICDLQVILWYVCLVTFWSKTNLKFLWSGNSLQWLVFFAFSLMFLTWTPSNHLCRFCQQNSILTKEAFFLSRLEATQWPLRLFASSFEG